MKSYKLLLVLGALIFLGCENKDRNKINRTIGFELKKEFTLSETATNKLFSFYPRATSANQSDVLGFANTDSPIGIILIDYDGDFVEQIGSKGRGPSELLSPRYFGFSEDDEDLIVRDNSLSMIKKFNRNSGDVTSYDDYLKEGINITSNIMKQCNDYWYLGISFFQEANQDSVNTIGVFDSDFRLIKTFGYPDPFFRGNKDVLKNPILDIDCSESLIYITHYKVPFIQVYELEDHSLVHRIDHKPESFKVSEQFIEMVYDRGAYQDMLINKQSSSIFIFNNEEHIILIFRQATEDYFKHRDFNDFIYEAAVYSKNDYRLIDEVPVHGIPVGATKEGYLITMLNENQDEYIMQLLDVVRK